MRKYKQEPYTVPPWIYNAIQVLRPAERLTVSEWAAKYRVLPDGNAIPGPWSNSVTPYLVEIMDAFSDDTVEEIVFVKPTQVGGTSAMENMLGSLIAPIFKPLGFGDWRASTALITGFTAKESMVSTLTLLLGGDAGKITAMFSPYTAVVFLVFTLLYTPCVAAIATVKREMGSAADGGLPVRHCLGSGLPGALHRAGLRSGVRI